MCKYLFVAEYYDFVCFVFLKSAIKYQWRLLFKYCTNMLEMCAVFSVGCILV